MKAFVFLGGLTVALAGPVLVHEERAVQSGYVNVSVATIWTNPRKPRTVDAPALTSPAHIQKWLDSMTVKQYLDLTDDNRIQTQAVYGTKVDILHSHNGWYKIAVIGQPTPKNALGYPGWAPANQIILDADFGILQQSKPFAQLDKAATAPIYADSSLSEKIMNISYDSRLPMLSQAGDSIEVAIPGGGHAYLSNDDATVYDTVTSIPYPSGEDLVASSKMFLGRPYLWGGTSGFAFDCAGLTHTIYQAHGIEIGRDASAQAMPSISHGISVPKAELRKGDVMFWASNLSDVDTVYHDAMYVRDGMMVEAYGAGIPVRITTVRFNKDYWGAKRFLAH